MSGISSRLDANQVLRESYDDAEKRLRVQASVTATVAEMDVVIDAAGGDNIAIADQSGTNFMTVYPNGAIPVVVTDSGLTTKNIFQEVINIPAGVTQIVGSYTALANTKLLSCDFGGTNVAEYSLYIGNDLTAKKYTFFQNLNERFLFADGLPVNNGDIITVEVLHNRPDPGNFSVNILIKN